ncbi:hypothetical protein MKW94_028613, partial [Papaver nudicaule]|nr:hypothetical protein [Papaver nudicaule]
MSSSKSVKRPKVHIDHKIMSSSKSIYETVEGSHEYIVEGYSLAKGMGVGKSMTSGKFTVAGYDWVINFYPDGYDQANQEYVCLDIQLLSPGEVRASFEFKLLDRARKRVLRRRSESPQTFITKKGWYVRVFLFLSMLNTL